MSADSRFVDRLLRLAVFCGLMVPVSGLPADDSEAPDPEFLEYLGSWEETDETWLIFSADIDDVQASDERDKENGNEPAPNGEKLAETDDEY